MWYADCRVLHNLWLCNFVYVAYSTTLKCVENGHIYNPSIVFCNFFFFTFPLCATPVSIYQAENGVAQGNVPSVFRF